MKKEEVNKSICGKPPRKQLYAKKSSKHLLLVDPLSQRIVAGCVLIKNLTYKTSNANKFL